jgi:hypothetical protein
MTAMLPAAAIAMVIKVEARIILLTNFGRKPGWNQEVTAVAMKNNGEIRTINAIRFGFIAWGTLWDQ